MDKRKHSITNVFLSVSGLIILEKVFGFIKQVLVASKFGATIQTDIINLSQGLVSDIHYILSQVLITSFISIYIHISENEDEAKAKKFAGSSILLFVGLAICISCLLFFFAPILSQIIAPSYDRESLFSLTQHIKLYAPIVAVFVLICVFKATLNANKNFIPEQISNLNQSVIMIVLVIAIGDVVGADTLVVGFFAYTIFNAFFLGVLCRNKIIFEFSNPLSDPFTKQLLSMMGPLLVSYSLIYVNQMVDKILVSGLGEGVITALGYGAVLSGLVTTFINTFCNMFFSYVTSEISCGNDSGAGNMSTLTLTALIIVFLPVSIITIFCSQEIVSIVYGHGAFDKNAVESSSWALKGYAVMFLPVIFREVLTRLQYGYKETKQPMLNGAIGIISNIFLSIILCKYYGVFGVAVATSLSIVICSVLNYFSACKINSFMKWDGFVKELIPVSIAGVISCVTMFLANKKLNEYSDLFRLVLLSLVGLGIYTVALFPVIKRKLFELRDLRK